MRQQFFLFLECDIGKAYLVAQTILNMDLPFCSEIALVSGEWDIVIRSECDSDVDVGKALVSPIQTIEGVRRTWTEIGYPIFDPSDVYFDPEGH